MKERAETVVDKFSNITIKSVNENEAHFICDRLVDADLLMSIKSIMKCDRVVVTYTPATITKGVIIVAYNFY